MNNEHQAAFNAKLELLLKGQPAAKVTEITDAYRLALKEAQREFRYAAVDKVQAVRERWMLTHNFPAAERMLDEMVGALHNLPFPTLEKP